MKKDQKFMKQSKKISINNLNKLKMKILIKKYLQKIPLKILKKLLMNNNKKYMMNFKNNKNKNKINKIYKNLQIDKNLQINI